MGLGRQSEDAKDLPRCTKAAKLSKGGFYKAYLSGTSGYRKSHLLASLTCLLIKEGKRAVHITNCRVVLRDFGGYVALSLLLCFANPGVRQIEVLACDEDVLRLISCCNRLAQDGEKLILIVSKYNALDWEDPGVDDTAN